MATASPRHPGPTPSAQELVAALSAPDLAAPAPAPTYSTLRLMRPRLVSRALLVGAIGLLAGTALLALTLAWSLGQLRRAVALAAAAALPVTQVPLPAAERLCDDGLFATWLARHPDDGPRLYVARALALIAAKRGEDAATAFAAAAARGRLDAPARVAWADLLCDLDRPLAAQEVLASVDLSPLPPDQLRRALAVAGRAHLGARRPAVESEAP